MRKINNYSNKHRVIFGSAVLLLFFSVVPYSNAQIGSLPNLCQTLIENSRAKIRKLNEAAKEKNKIDRIKCGRDLGCMKGVDHDYTLKVREIRMEQARLTREQRECAIDAKKSGDLQVKGNITKSGGSFKIDHPLDPANKFLYHSFVESPDMKNIYDGVVVLNEKGESVIQLPKWFDALNKDFRYLLTPIGAPGPNLYIAEEIVENHFKIAGGVPGLKVSWQVTGIRQDAWANAHRIPIEQSKPKAERGSYLHPSLFNQPETKGGTPASSYRN